MLKTEVFLEFDHSLAGVIIDKGENSQYDSKLRNTNAGTAKGINNIPGMTKPGRLGKDEPANQGRKSETLIVALRENVAAGSITNQKTFADLTRT